MDAVNVVRDREGREGHGEGRKGGRVIYRREMEEGMQKEGKEGRKGHVSKRKGGRKAKRRDRGYEGSCVEKEWRRRKRKEGKEGRKSYVSMRTGGMKPKGRERRRAAGRGGGQG